MEQKELCIRCNKPTSYLPNTPITLRRYYVEGSDQLCPLCYQELYGVAPSLGGIASRNLCKFLTLSLKEQNRILENNYNKLKNMYVQQVKINNQYSEELEQSRKYNRWMMIAIFAMLAAIASPVVTLIVSH